MSGRVATLFIIGVFAVVFGTNAGLKGGGLLFGVEVVGALAATAAIMSPLVTLLERRVSKRLATSVAFLAMPELALFIYFYVWGWARMLAAG